MQRRGTIIFFECNQKLVTRILISAGCVSFPPLCRRRFPLSDVFVPKKRLACFFLKWDIFFLHTSGRRSVFRKVRYLLYVRRCELARVSSDKRANPFAGGQTWKFDSSCGGVSACVCCRRWNCRGARVVCLLLIGLAPFGRRKKC
jgi:hypothetical protein